MLSTSKIKYLRSLQLKKFRQKYNKFVVEGDKIVREICEQHPQLIEEIYALPEWLDKNKLSISLKSQSDAVSAKELERISGMKTPNQVLAVVRQPDQTMPAEGQIGPICLLLDGIQDPGNLGTILRTADWFGISSVFCTPDTVEVFNPKTIQASMGAVFRVGVYYVEGATLKNYLSGFTFYGAFMEGTPIFETEVTDKNVIVIGNEGQGIRSDILKILDQHITIPKGNGSQAESLNAGIATGIILANFAAKV